MNDIHLDNRSHVTPGADPSPPADIVHIADLSFGQQRLWILDRLMPDASIYNAVRVQRLTGLLNVAALTRALDEVVTRHEILRTRFVLIDDAPKQMIMAPTPLMTALRIDDLTQLPEPERQAEAEAQVRDACASRFHLERETPLRCSLIRLAPDEHWLVLVLHHIATDVWSAAVLAKEISALYAAFIRGLASPLSPLALQYCDYAAWQHQWLQGEVLEQHRRYWKTALADLPVLALPTDHARPPVADGASGSCAFHIDAKTTAALSLLARREGATPFMTLLAAFQVLLYRYSGQDDVAVGVAVSGRGRPELRDLIGFFVNMLVMRGDLGGQPTFKAYLARVRAVALNAYTHQDMPFEKIVEDMAPRRDTSRNPLFQVAFVFQNAMPVEWKLPGLAAERIEHIGAETAKFDLTMTLLETSGTLSGRIDYASSLFDAATIERMIGHWKTLLSAIIADPDTRISHLSLVDDAEHLALGSAHPRPRSHDHAMPPRDTFVHARVAWRAAQRPDAAAVRMDGHSVTYAELDARANRLAHHLLARGAGPDVLVALCVERSIDMIVAMLGVLKSGAAYLPLDAAHPAERLATIVRDAGARLMITQRHLRPHFAGFAGRLIDLDSDVSTLAAQPSTDPECHVDAHHLAYVIYTSGSTGQPKGVMVTHGNVARLFSATRQWFDFDDHDVWTCFHSCAFDFSVWEIWGALAYGGMLVVVPSAVARDATQFHALLKAERVTVLNQTPSAFAALDKATEVDSAALRLRVVIFGGEALNVQSLRGWIARHGDRAPRLVNMYGITETTVHVTYRPITATDIDDGAGSVIGQPIPDMHVALLDAFMQPVAVGIPGEIFVGGAGVARGYLNQPQLTAERFVADPFSDDSQARLYRSGDRARRLANGDLEFLGRIDSQIKLRGFRIEPGEIEAALIALPTVREAVVVAHGDTDRPADALLTAYVVAQADTHPTPVQLWTDIRQTLPDYMVPGAIVVLPAMPLTAQGKIDRRALPAPSDIAEQRIGWPGSRVPPQNPLDHMLAAIWEDLLGVRDIGIRDNFFDLGGHSLLAAQMVDVVERTCGVRVPLTVLFTHATIESFAHAMREDAVRQSLLVVAINAQGAQSPMFFLHGDFTGGGFFSNALARGLGSDRPFYAVHPHGLIDDEIPESIEAMAADRLAALRSTQPHGPYVLGGHCAGALVALEMAQQLVQQGEEVPLVVIMDAAAPMQRERVFESATVQVGGAATARERKTVPMAPTEPAGDDTPSRYLRAVRRYVPAPFAGRLVVLQPDSKRDIRPTLGWSAVNPAVEMYRIRGDHHTCITRYVNETAATLKACLDAE